MDKPKHFCHLVGFTKSTRSPYIYIYIYGGGAANFHLSMFD